MRVFRHHGRFRLRCRQIRAANKLPCSEALFALWGPKSVSHLVQAAELSMQIVQPRAGARRLTNRLPASPGEEGTQGRQYKNAPDTWLR